MNYPQGHELPQRMSVMLGQASRWTPVMDGYRFVAKIDRCLMAASTLPEVPSHRRTLACLHLASRLEEAAAIALPHYPGTSRMQMIHLLGGMMSIHTDGLMAEPEHLEVWEHTIGRVPNTNLPGYYHRVKRPAPIATLGNLAAATCTELSHAASEEHRRSA
jgi:hypothetical protein